jgi:putative lipoprotein
MKLKFFLALILVVLLCGCSLLSQGDEEASLVADASRCDVISSLNKEQSNRCAKRQKIDAEVARAAQKQAVSQDTLNSFRADSAQAQQRAQEQYIAAQQSLMQQQSQQQLEQMQQRQNMRNLQNEQSWNRLRNLENISSGRI